MATASHEKSHVGKCFQLEPESTTFAHRDGADFGLWGGVRSERCQSIVIDEQRSHGPKSARPEGLPLEGPRTASPCLSGQPVRPAQGSLPGAFQRQSRRANVVDSGSNSDGATQRIGPPTASASTGPSKAMNKVHGVRLRHFASCGLPAGPKA